MSIENIHGAGAMSPGPASSAVQQLQDDASTALKGFYISYIDGSEHIPTGMGQSVDAQAITTFAKQIQNLIVAPGLTQNQQSQLKTLGSAMEKLSFLADQGALFSTDMSTNSGPLILAAQNLIESSVRSIAADSSDPSLKILTPDELSDQLHSGLSAIESTSYFTAQSNPSQSFIFADAAKDMGENMEQMFTAMLLSPSQSNHNALENAQALSDLFGPVTATVEDGTGGGCTINSPISYSDFSQQSGAFTERMNNALENLEHQMKYS